MRVSATGTPSLLAKEVAAVMTMRLQQVIRTCLRLLQCRTRRTIGKAARRAVAEVANAAETNRLQTAAVTRCCTRVAPTLPSGC